MTDSPTLDDGATLRLSPDEAVVLFELLSRWSDPTAENETPSRACFEDTAEPAVLNNLLGMLERQLVAPLSAEYEQIVARARGRLAYQWSYATLRG